MYLNGISTVWIIHCFFFGSFLCLSFILMSFLCQATPSILFLFLSISLFLCVFLSFCLFLSSAVWLSLMSTPWWSTGASPGKVPPSLLSHGYRSALAMASLSFFLFPLPTIPPFLFYSSPLVLSIPLPVLFCRDLYRFWTGPSVGLITQNSRTLPEVVDTFLRAQSGFIDYW